MTREEMKKTKEWQALNTIWKTMNHQQREQILEQFRCLTEFINKHATPVVDYAAVDADYKSVLSPETAAFAAEREQEGRNLYAEFMKLIGGSTFEAKEKVLFFYNLKYGKNCPWLQDYPDEVEELLDLAWKRQVQRGFVPGEGMRG